MALHPAAVEYEVNHPKLAPTSITKGGTPSLTLLHPLGPLRMISNTRWVSSSNVPS
jgi:hypothetical protein